MKRIFTSLFALGIIGNAIGWAAPIPATSEFSSDQDLKIIAKYGREPITQSNTPHKVVKKAAAVNESTAPEGLEKLYSTDWMCLMYDYIVDDTGIATRMRFAEDGKVYIHDLFSTGMDYWVNANLENNNIVIPLHQQVATTQNGIPLSLEVSKFRFEDDYMWSEIDYDASVYTLTGHDDGSFTSSDLNLDWTERIYPVLCDPDGGTYYLIGSIVCSPVDDSLVTPPADKEPQTFSYSYFAGNFQQAKLVNVVKDGNDIYVEGLAPALPDVWLKGEYTNDGKQISFKSGQFMGASQYVHYFSAAQPNPLASADNPDEPNWLKEQELICDVNEDGVIEFRADRYLAVTIADDVAYTVKPRVLALYNDSGETPAKPIITEMLWMEVDFLAFVQPTLDVNGTYLNPDNLYWRLYFDDQLFTFETWEYWGLSEDKTEIPYGFDDNWDFMFYNDIGEQMVAIYKSDYRNIGIESVYRVGDKEFVSERAYYGDTTSAIQQVENAASDILDSTYFDLSGRKVANPTSGIYLKADHLSNGTTRTRKVTIR